MKIWIDDIRKPPDWDWLWARSSAEAITLLDTYPVNHISFDHDLGGDDTAMRVAVVIEKRAHDDTMGPVEWAVHSANPVGRDNIRKCMESAERFWRGHGHD